MSLLRKLKSLWMAFGHVFGQIQTTILLSIIYHITLGPIALIGKVMRADLLHLRSSQGESFAEQLPRISTTLESAEKQF